MTQSEYVGALLVPVVRPRVGWELSEETMPVTELHAHAVDVLRQLLRHWATKSGARIVWELAVRWVPEDARIGVDPDVAILLPPPPVPDLELKSLYTWKEGHAPPLVAIEVVSESDPHKDYSIAPAKYSASGTKELWIFDPLLTGPSTFGGPFRLQVYRRDEKGRFVRIYEGDGPTRSPALDAWLIVTDDGRKLRIANDEAGNDFWLTEAEAARSEAEVAHAEIAALKAELAKRGG